MQKPPPVHRSLIHRALRVASFPLIALAAFILWLEEWLWEPLERLMQCIAQLPILRQIEALVRRAPPLLALALFIIPILALLPFKLAGLWLLAHGHAFSGISTFLCAKVVGTALGARLLTLVKPTLMTLPWFARAWAGFIKGRDWVYERVRSNLLWQATKRFKQRIKETLTGASKPTTTKRLLQRWRMILRRMRRP